MYSVPRRVDRKVSAKKSTRNVRSKHLTPPHIFEAVEGIVEAVPNHRKVKASRGAKSAGKKSEIAIEGREGGKKTGSVVMNNRGGREKEKKKIYIYILCETQTLGHPSNATVSFNAWA